MAELCQLFELHDNQIAQGKRPPFAHAADTFEDRSKPIRQMATRWCRCRLDASGLNLLGYLSAGACSRSLMP